MIDSGWILYVLLVGLLYLFWRNMRGLSFSDLLEKDARKHNHAQQIIARYPGGGTWREHEQWMKRPKTKLRKSTKKK